MYNKLVVLGNLTKDGESKFLPSGTEVYKNSIASTHKFKKQDGTTEEEVCFLDFTCFGGQASICSKYLKKGSKVLLEGRLKFEQWTAQDGSNRSRHILSVDTMKMLDSKSQSDNQGQNYNQEPQVVYENNYNQSRSNVEHRIPDIDIDPDEVPF